MASAEIIESVHAPFLTPEIVAPQRVWRYECALSPQHVDATTLPPSSSKYIKEYFEHWLKSAEREEDKLGHVSKWARETIRQIPGGIDVARDVDGGGFTMDKIQPTLFMPWVNLQNGTWVRFSESRTAMHNNMLTTKGFSGGGALRSPVMGGVVLEATNDPTSLDPRDAVSLAIYEFAKEYDARYPWAQPRKARVYDMTPYTVEPYFVGPLYNGHPNEVLDPGEVNRAINTAVTVLNLTVEQAISVAEQ